MDHIGPCEPYGEREREREREKECVKFGCGWTAFLNDKNIFHILVFGYVDTIV